MKIRYKTIKKIHLYACLSTAAILLMFILTSYVMIYHDRFDHEATTHSEIVNYDTTIDSVKDYEKWAHENGVPGRKVKSYENPAGHPVLEYQNASTHTRITFIPVNGKVEIVRNQKSSADAFVGIHRHRGYGGGLSYNVYAFFLDILGVSLILFSITGLIMWLKILKGSKWAWIILFAGFGYFMSVFLYLTFS